MKNKILLIVLALTSFELIYSMNDNGSNKRSRDEADSISRKKARTDEISQRSEIEELSNNVIEELETFALSTQNINNALESANDAVNKTSNNLTTQSNLLKKLQIALHIAKKSDDDIIQKEDKSSQSNEINSDDPVPFATGNYDFGDEYDQDEKKVQSESPIPSLFISNEINKPNESPAIAQNNSDNLPAILSVNNNSTSPTPPIPTFGSGQSAISGSDQSVKESANAQSISAAKQSSSAGINTTNPTVSPSLTARLTTEDQYIRAASTPVFQVRPQAPFIPYKATPAPTGRAMEIYRPQLTGFPTTVNISQVRFTPPQTSSSPRSTPMPKALISNFQSITTQGSVIPLANPAEKNSQINTVNNSNQGMNSLELSKMKVLHQAMITGDEEIIKALISTGKININTQGGPGHNSALHLAISLNNLKTVTLVLQAPNLNPNLKNKNGETALHMAIRLKQLDVTRELINAKTVSKNLADKDGNTPLHLATIINQEEVVKLLLEKNADVYLTNNENKTAKEIAIEKGFNNIVELITQKEQS